jgi:hypothetical protein
MGGLIQEEGEEEAEESVLLFPKVGTARSVVAKLVHTGSQKLHDGKFSPDTESPLW